MHGRQVTEDITRLHQSVQSWRKLAEQGPGLHPEVRNPESVGGLVKFFI